MFFDSIPAAPADPILGLGEAFKAETRAEKVNLGNPPFSAPSKPPKPACSPAKTAKTTSASTA